MNQTPDRAEFVTQLTGYQRRLFGYIATLLPNPADTEEVLQQTNMVLWSKAHEFEPGTSFRAWSFRIAHLEVLGFLRRGSRERHLFGGALVETMAAEVEAFDSERPTQALRTCLEKLSAADRDLIGRRYAVGATVKQVAESQNRPASSIYRSLDRIRYWLLECIQRALAAEGRQ